MKKNSISGFVGIVLVLMLSLPNLVLAVDYDLIKDGYINWKDLDVFVDKWLFDCSVEDCNGANFDDDNNNVDFDDYTLLAQHWLEQLAPSSPPIGWWKLDELSGTTAYDSSGNDYNGTVVGAAWEPGGGQIDGAARFASGSQRIEIPTDGMSASAGTVALWGRPEGPQTQYYRYFFACRDLPGGDNRVQLYLYQTTMQLGAGLGGAYNLNTNIMTLSTDTWYHIALTWDGTNYIVYVDANNVASGTYSGLSSITTGGDIGNDHQDRDKAFYGLIDDVGVWNLALDANEVECIYLNGITLLPTPGRATNPNPNSEATDVNINADLSWTAGTGADSHDVYFGTDESPDAGEFKVNQTETTYDPGTLDYYTTHYWRIDGNNAYGTTTGNVWNFTTEAAPGPPGQASNPSPANEVNNVDIYADLSWTAGAGATSHDVYFGTISPGAFQGNQPGTTFDPCIMDANTTYYWCIDEKNTYGTTAGDVWSFTTAVPGVPVANFMVIPTSGWDIYYKPEFVSKATGDITSYLWEFGDTQTSTGRAPNHQYSSAGTYTVTLTVTGPGGSDSMTKTNHITVNDFNDYPYADYNITEPNMAQWDDAVDAIETAGGGRILFGFSSQTIYVNHHRDFFGNNCIVDGQDKNVKFYYNGPDDCSQTEGQDALIRFHGNDNIFRNLDFDRFPEGVHIRSGNRNLIENCNVGVICEDAMSMNGGGYECFDCIMRNCTYGASDDKAVMVNNGGRGVFRNLSFTNSTQPIRCTGSTGEYVIRHCNVGGESNSFRHSGGSPGQLVYVEENTVNAKRGIRVYGSAHAIIRHNTFTGGNYHGVYVFDSAKVRLEHNNIQNFTQGGVMIQNTAQVDLGGGSVSIDGSSTAGIGGNTIQGNSPYDLINQTGSTVKAKFNYWDHTTVENVLLLDVSGSADVDPLGTP